MASYIVMPKLGLTMIEGTISSWLKKEGDYVTKGEPLIEVTTEKITLEVEALETGVLRKILVEEGTTVPIQEPIGIIGEADEDISKYLSGEIIPESHIGMNENQREVSANKSLAETPAIKDRIKASPAAKKMAEEHGIDLSGIAGTGPGGRINLSDVQKAVDASREVEQLQSEYAQIAVSSNSVPLQGLRKVIADKMSLSIHSTAQLTLTMEVDATDLVKLRHDIREEMAKTEQVKITYNDLIVKAAAMALKDYPLMNSTLVDNNIIIGDTVNLGIAVALKDGLMVPVIKNAAKKSLATSVRKQEIWLTALAGDSSCPIN